ncbi:TAXI family TRAP transporter solute-binding subunit [Desulfococcaceae bacterium HSG7]|nr:TAXI family TRAP transporter solute-binding subunit [Desulfococcaceae bacterium HSG7]
MLKLLTDFAKTINSFIGFAALVILSLLALFIWLFSRGAFDSFLTNFERLTRKQFFWIIVITLLMLFSIVIIFIPLSFWATSQDSSSSIFMYSVIVHENEDETLGVKGAEVILALPPEPIEKQTDSKGNAVFFFSSNYKGKKVKLNARKPSYFKRDPIDITLENDKQIFISLKPKNNNLHLNSISSSDDNNTAKKLENAITLLMESHDKQYNAMLILKKQIENLQTNKNTIKPLYNEGGVIGISTGNIMGTYYRIGQDIKSLAFMHGLTVNVYPSAGAIENIDAVYRKKSIQFGIVQSDLLAYLKSSTNADRKRISNKIKIVFPLYNEEVHLLANKHIQNFSDLDGKKIAMGFAGSGTYLTSTLIFSLSGIRPAVIFETGGKEAVKDLLEGNIDAMLYVSGYPVKLFEKIKSDRIHLISIKNKEITENFAPSIIPPSTYSWQKESVFTVAVKSVLITYDYKKTGATCNMIKKVTKIISNNLSRLKQVGHLKWNEVDLNASLHGWEKTKCLEIY